MIALLVTALLPPTLAYGATWLFPLGCDVRQDPSLYRSTCLLPGLVFVVSPVAAAVLGAAYWLNSRLSRRFPDGWLAAALFTGAGAYIVLIGGYAILLGEAYRSVFFQDMVFLQQPFVAGAVSGFVFAAVLALRQRPA